MTAWLSEGETRIITATQRILSHPSFLLTAQIASHFGEHSLGWLAISSGGAVLDPRRRQMWIRAGAAAFTAHAAAVAVKRVVRRPRPHSDAVTVGVATPSALSFPSAHAASTTAFALAVAPFTGAPIAALTIGGMAVSRVRLGVHYPTDVVAGAVLGAASLVGLHHSQKWVRG